MSRFSTKGLRVLATAIGGLAIVLGSVVAAQPASAATPCVKQTFQNGSRGRCVQDIQLMFNNWGAYPPIAYDGVYGPNTKNAIIDFQRYTSYGLTADGIVGPKTWAALCKVNGPTGPAVDAGCSF